MKLKFNPFLYRFLPPSLVISTGLSVAAFSSVQAATYWWDNNDADAGFGTAGGTWGISPFWNTSATGQPAPTVTTTLPADDVNFGTSTDGLDTGSIDVTETQSFRNMTFGSASGAITLAVGGILDLAEAGSTITVNNTTNTISSSLTGTGSLTKAGTGSLELTAENSYSGGTFLNAGTLVAGSNSALGSGDLTLGGGTLSINGGIALTNNLVSTASTTTSVLFNNAAGGTLSGALTGSGTVNFSFTATTFVIPNLPTMSAFTGTIGIDTSKVGVFPAILATGAPNATVSVTGVSPNGGSTTGSFLYSNTGGTTIALGALTGDGIIAGNFTTWEIGNLNTNTTFNGIIENNPFFNGGPSLTKVGSGTLTLSGANTYTGQTRITAGTLSFSGTGSLTGNTSNFVINGGSLEVASGASISTAGEFTVGDGAVGSSVTQNGGTVSNGSWFMVGRTTPGSYDLVGGTLNAGTTGGLTAIGMFPGAGGSVMNVSGGTFNDGVDGLRVGADSTGTLNVSGSGSVVVDNAVGLRLGTNNTGTNTVNLDGGTLAASKVAKGLAGATGIFNFNGGTLKATVTNTSNFMAGLSAANVKAGGAVIDSNSFDITIASNLAEDPGSPGGGLTKNGAGVLTLGGVNSYTGDTSVNAGSLAVDGDSIADTGKLVINAGKVDVTGNETVNTLFFGAAQQAATTYGSTLSAAVVKDDTRFSGTGILTVTVGGSVAGYSGWASANAPGQTKDQDHDFDGVDNGIEYFMGLSGSGFTPNPGLVAGTVTWTKGGSYAGVYGTDFVVQSSTDLVNWTDVPVGTGALGTVANNAGSVSYTPPIGQAKRFGRLVVNN